MVVFLSQPSGYNRETFLNFREIMKNVIMILEIEIIQIDI